MLSALIDTIKNMFFLIGAVVKKSSFPPPLSAEEENRLISALEAGDAEARNALIEHNLRLVAHISKKYASSGKSMDDLISIGTIGLIKAIDTFNHAKCKTIAGYASRCIENELLMFLRSEKKHSGEVSLEEPIGTDRDGNEITLSDILSNENEQITEDIVTRSNGSVIRKAVDALLTAQEKSVIRLRYGLNGGEPLAQREVGRLLGISRSYVSRIEKRALSKLNAYLSGRI